jgi:hypothetical protein
MVKKTLTVSLLETKQKKKPLIDTSGKIWSEPEHWKNVHGMSLNTAEMLEKFGDRFEEDRRKALKGYASLDEMSNHIVDTMNFYRETMCVGSMKFFKAFQNKETIFTKGERKKTRHDRLDTLRTTAQVKAAEKRGVEFRK